MKRTASTTPAAPHEASGHQSPLRLHPGSARQFSRSQKDVAQYIVDHLDEVAFQTAEELARRANTSSSTVVRFSQALGFEGFRELQTAARRGVPARGRSRPGRRRCVGAAVFSLDQNEFETAIAADT